MAGGELAQGRGVVAAQFRSAPVRGEASPGYTSPSFPSAAERMARVVPGARLVYAVRDPIERAVSQYFHHWAEGTERRPIEEALLDPASQYLERSRYHARLEPYLSRFPRKRIFICAQEDPLTKWRGRCPRSTASWAWTIRSGLRGTIAAGTFRGMRQRRSPGRCAGAWSRSYPTMPLASKSWRDGSSRAGGSDELRTEAAMNLFSSCTFIRSRR